MTGILAIEGGAPVRSAPFPPWPHFAEDEVEAASAVLRSGRVNYWTGSECRRFEEEFASAFGTRHAVALANGTVALEIALRSVGVGPGDDVVVPARTFIATASAAVMVGARPIVADVDPVTQVVTRESIAAALTPATKAIVVVHLAGHPCDMGAIVPLAADRGLLVIEDCAQAHGATWEGRAVGSFGDVSAFSFCQDKIMTTCGEGGMLLTCDDVVWERACELKDHGKGLSALAAARQGGPGFKWVHTTFGTNARMTEMQAAVGRRQLEKLPDWVAQRRRNAAQLSEGLGTVPGIEVAVPPSSAGHAYYKYYVTLDLDRLAEGWSRDRVVGAIAAEGVPCQVGSCPEIYRERAFLDRGLGLDGRLPHARALGERSMLFLVHPTLGASEMEDTVEATGKVMRAAVR